MKYRDHHPGTDSTKSAMLHAYEETRGLYEKVFGQIDKSFWPSIAEDVSASGGACG